MPQLAAIRAPAALRGTPTSPHRQQEQGRRRPQEGQSCLVVLAQQSPHREIKPPCCTVGAACPWRNCLLRFLQTSAVKRQSVVSEVEVTDPSRVDYDIFYFEGGGVFHCTYWRYQYCVSNFKFTDSFSPCIVNMMTAYETKTVLFIQ